MIRTLIITLAALCILTPPAYATVAEGLWLTENKRSVIKVEQCDEGLCGYIHWIIKGGMQYDSKNPDESLRNTPMCGLKILHGFEQDKNNSNIWKSGNIYKADDGDIYAAEVEVLNETEMKVTGYIGFTFLGKTQTWTRVDAKQYPTCRK